MNTEERLEAYRHAFKNAAVVFALFGDEKLTGYEIADILSDAAKHVEQIMDNQQD